MAEETNPGSIKTDLLPPSPSLSPELNNLYNSLDNDNQRIFIKVFGFLWGVVNRKRSGVVPSFWLVDLLRLQSCLTSSELSILTYLYLLSHKGARWVHSEQVYNSIIMPNVKNECKPTLLNGLKRKGYITRSTRDPGQPYSQRAQHNKQPVYIFLTSKGVKLIEKLEKDLYNMLMRSSLDELTGIKKPR